jgi:DNA-binding LytR/AlgR family response regulator
MVALVLEDERIARSYLVELVEKSGLAHVVAAVSSPALASEALREEGNVDVAFVDVTLVDAPDAERAGLAWIEEIREGSSAPVVVITTASREHALRGFELGVVDYLLKPYVLDRVRESLTRVAARLPARATGARAPGRPPRIVARKGKSLVFLSSGEAWAFEAEGRLCFVHCDDGRFDVDLSLSALQAVLGEGFARVHRNWLVAIDHVRAMNRDSGEMTLRIGDGRSPRSLQVTVARDRVGAVRELLLAATVGLRRDE